MLTQAYQFQLNYDITPGLCLTAKLFQDSITPVLVCITNIGKVLMYAHNNTQQNIQFLNINKKIKCLAVCQFKTNQAPSEKLLLASQNTLITYDVERNTDMFYKEIQDGISALCSGFTAITSGKLKQTQEIAFVGGDCSIQGFDSVGEEVYWNVTGDQVTTMFISPPNSEQQSYLFVGSTDSTVRIFHQEEILLEIQLSSSPIVLTGLDYQEDILFAYGLENGNIGVYKAEKLLWSSKDSVKVVSIVHCIWDSDASEKYKPLLIGRIDGSIEIRKDLTGDLVYRHQSQGLKLASLLFDDLRGTKTKQLIAVYQDGNVKGYTLGGQLPEQVKGEATFDASKFNELYEQLNDKKQQLLTKLAAFNELTKNKNDGQTPLLPKTFQILTGFGMNQQQKCIDLVLQSNTDGCYIKQAILLSDSLFEPYESFVYTPDVAEQMIRIPMRMIKENKQQEVRIKALVCSNNQSSLQFQVVEAKNNIAKFSNFALQTDSKAIKRPISFLIAQIKERMPRYVKWLDQCFIIDDRVLEKLEQSEELHLSFQNVQDLQSLCIDVSSIEGKVTISTESIELAGDLISDLSNFLNLQELNTVGEFPIQMEEFKRTLTKIEQYKSAKFQLNADVAESINNIKSLVVKAEDSRFVGDLQYMKKMYSNIMVENKSLQSEMLKQNQNNEGLMDALREVNSMISKAANLRVGNAKTQVTNLCRNSVKKNNLHQLINIIQLGREA